MKKVIGLKIASNTTKKEALAKELQDIFKDNMTTCEYLRSYLELWLDSFFIITEKDLDQKKIIDELGSLSVPDYRLVEENLNRYHSYISEREDIKKNKDEIWNKLGDLISKKILGDSKKADDLKNHSLLKENQLIQMREEYIIMIQMIDSEIKKLIKDLKTKVYCDS